MTHTIQIYSTPTCPYCKMAKAYFTELGLAYSDYNVATDLQKRQEMIEKTHQLGVPVIDIDGNIIIGFDKEGIDEILGKN